jgi:hypothetical protein
MCSDTDSHWARTYFNRTVSGTLLGLELNDMRHVWIALTQQAVHTFCTSHDQTKLKVYMEAAARLSGHSPEQEAATYAGQANIGGVESLDRSTFRQVSDIFNAFVFGTNAEKMQHAATEQQQQQLHPPCNLSAAAAEPVQHQLSKNSKKMNGFRDADQGKDLSAGCKRPSLEVPGFLHPHSLNHKTVKVAVDQQDVEESEQLAPVPSFPFAKLPTLEEFDQFIADTDDIAYMDLVMQQVVDNPEITLNAVDNAAIPADAATDYVIIRRKVEMAVQQKSSILLHQRPGFGKTRLTMKLLKSDTLFLFLVPTVALRDQV